MWTPISTGIPMQGTEAKNLNDAQSTAQSAEKKPSAQKKKQKSASKKKKPPKQKKQQKPDESPDEVPQGSVLSPKRTEQLRRAASERRQKHAIAATRREDEQARRLHERSQEAYRRQRSQGRSGDDIRMRAAQKKRKAKQLRAILIVAALMVVALIGTAIYCYSYGAPISFILVEGNSVYTSEQIVAASGIEAGDNMLRIRERAVNKRLCAALPYIGEVEVDYRLPDTLALVVHPTTEKLLISGKTGYICLNEDDKIVSLKKRKLNDGQYRLDGFDPQTGAEGTTFVPEGDNKARLEAAKKIVAELEANELQKANILLLGDLSDIILRYDGRVNIYLGTTENLSVRLKAAAETIKGYLGENTIGYLEITHQGKVYLYEGSMTKV